MEEGNKNTTNKLSARFQTVKSKFREKYLRISSKIVSKRSHKIAFSAAIFTALLLIVAAGYLVYSARRDNQIRVTDSSSGETIQETKQIPEKLYALQTKVTLVRGGETVNLEAGEDKELEPGDKITTDVLGIAEIIYESGSVVRLSPETSITISSSESIFQDIGKVYVRFSKVLGVQESFEVETPTSIAAVRGTAFTSIVEEGKDRVVIVTDHEVIVIPKGKDGTRLDELSKNTKSGEEALVGDDSRVVEVKGQEINTELQEWLDFNDLSDKKERNFNDLVKEFKTLQGIKPTPTPAPSVASPTPIPQTPISGSMPGSGYHRGSVVTSVGTFTLACYGANKGSVRMVTDSASDSDCSDNCPVLPLDAYATRNGGIAAINGMYFCPSDYPACAGKVNTFDTLFFNSRTRNYINSANNVYSTIPFVGMNSDHSMSFVGQSLQWGRDTGIIGGTAGNPLLTAGGSYVVNEGALDDKQRNVKSNRGAIVQDGDAIYLCITQGATVPDSGRVYETLGADNAINIDGGGSSALWVQGSYKYGPGRQIPSAIILAP